jgi:hypothetical protein
MTSTIHVKHTVLSGRTAEASHAAMLRGLGGGGGVNQAQTRPPKKASIYRTNKHLEEDTKKMQVRGAGESGWERVGEGGRGWERGWGGWEQDVRLPVALDVTLEAHSGRVLCRRREHRVEMGTDPR